MMKGQKGITLVALIITIIVMLILVAVSVTVALNGGLFTKAKSAASQTNEAEKAENDLADGYVNVDGNRYELNDYATNSSPTAVPAE